MLNLNTFQKAQFVRDGYLVLPDLLSGDLLHTAKWAVLSNQSAHPSGMSKSLGNDPMITDLYEDSILAAYPELLLGDWKSQRSHNTTITVNHPESIEETKPLVPQLDEMQCELLATVVLTTQRTRESGNLVVWKTSHEYPVETCHPETLKCRSGDVVLHHGKLSHAFERNHCSDTQMMVTFRIHHKDKKNTLHSRDPFSEWHGMKDIEMFEMAC